MNCQLNIFESLSTFLRKWILRTFLSEVLPSLPGPHEPGYYNSRPKNSMRIPVTNERAGVGTAVIRNRSCAIRRDNVGVEIH